MGDQNNRFRSLSAKLTVVLGCIVILSMILNPLKTIITNQKQTAKVNELVKIETNAGQSKTTKTVEGVQTIPGDSNGSATNGPTTTVQDGAFGVSASNPIAAQVAMEVLKQGGNAADAATAAALTLTVVEPHASSLGGAGGAVVYTPSDQKVTQIMYREKSSASEANLTKKVGVPGLAKGLEYLMANFGSVDEKTVIEPARKLAADGFKMDSSLFEIWQRYKFGRMLEPEANELFFPNGIMKTFVQQPELAKTLQYLGDNGLASFYKEPFASELASEIGAFSADDLKNYTIEVGDAVHANFQGWDIYTSAPPSSGITFIQMLKMMEQVGLNKYSPDSAEYYHYIADITNLAYRSRFLELTDPSVDPINVSALISDDYTKNLSGQIKPDVRTSLSKDQYVPSQDGSIIPDEITTPGTTTPGATTPESTAPTGTTGQIEPGNNPFIPEGQTHTTHLVVVDGTGMMVSMTNTIGTFFGTGEYVKGFFANNLLTNFNDYAKNPGVRGVNKSPRSFTAPSIMLKDGQILGLGSPGGARIPAMMAQGVANFAYYNLPLADAMNRYRIFADDAMIKTETPLNATVTTKLNNMGYQIDINRDAVYFGGIQALLFDPKTNTVDGASDSRRGGVWDSNHKMVHNQPEGATQPSTTTAP